MTTRMCRRKLHTLTPDNLTADGRACRACRRATQREWVAAYRKRSADLDALKPTALALVTAAAERRDADVQQLVAECPRHDLLIAVLARQLAGVAA